MTAMTQLNHPESDQPYFQEINDLLEKYEDGWNVFIKAHEAKDYDVPVPLKEGFEDDPYLPKDWLALADKVISIIAHEKYKLDTMPNRIEIVRADQMLDAYVRPVPDGPAHWSYGKARMIEGQKYDASKHLAYEIIINSNPALAYCMDTNSPVMQMLVFAHASYGHNAVYKNNYLFKDFSDPESIMAINQRLRELVDDSEEKYGIDEVEKVMDFCHSMRFMDSHDRLSHKNIGKKQAAEKAAKDKEKRLFNPPYKRILSDDYANAANENAEKNVNLSHPACGERNVLKFIADNAHHLPEWKRDIMRLSSEISQHFAPNITSKVLNEGFACITHHQIMETMCDMGLMNASMYGEFEQSHAGVTYQPPGYVEVEDPDTGEKQKRFVGSDINIYSLGYAIFEDIKRICEEPTQEDLEWFPHFAGKGDWIEMSKHVMESNNDETFIEQYLSPTVMRKFGYFLLQKLTEDELEERDDEYQYYADEYDFLSVSAIHADEGFRKVRAQLAADYRMSDKIPKISFRDYQEETDRCLVLQHDIINDQLLDRDSTQKILELIHEQTQHPVVLESIDSDGDFVDYYASPADYDNEPHQRTAMHYKLS